MVSDTVPNSDTSHGSTSSGLSTSLVRLILRRFEWADSSKLFLFKPMDCDLVFRCIRDVVNQCSEMNWRFCPIFSRIFSRLLFFPAILSYTLTQVTRSHNPAILLGGRFAQVRRQYLSSLCGRLFLPLRSFLSDDECSHQDSNVDLDKLHELFLFCRCRSFPVFDGVRIFVNMTWFPTHLLSSSDNPASNSYTRLVRSKRLCADISTHSHSYFLKVCRDGVSELCGKCNPVHALCWLNFASCPRRFCHFADFEFRNLRVTSKNFVTSSWMGIDESFLALGTFCQGVFFRTDDHRLRWVVKRCVVASLFGDHPFLLESVGVHHLPAILPWRVLNRSSIGSSTSLCRSKLPLSVEHSIDGHDLCPVKANTETNSRCSILSSSYLESTWESLQTAKKWNNQARCLAFPMIALTEILPPNEPKEKIQVPSPMM